MADKLSLTLALSEMTFLSFREKCVLEEKLVDLHELAVLSLAGISQLVGRAVAPRAWNVAGIEQRVEQAMRIMKIFDIRCILHSDNEYPARLTELYAPPFLLFVRGDSSILTEPCISVVGTRKPSREGMDAAYHFAEDAALDGYTVVSGLAFGIDSCVHQGALAGKGKTAAVLARGVDGVYPLSNRRIGEAMLTHGGCLVSEYMAGTPPEKWRFPQRNRIIAGLSEATVVIDAPGNSGALITADFALEQGRDVIVHRVSLDHIGAENEKKASRHFVMTYVAAGAPVIDSYEEYCSIRDRDQADSPESTCVPGKQLSFEGVGEWQK
jgi:DNA processing protein